jgi:hypothetical protein
LRVKIDWGDLRRARKWNKICEVVGKILEGYAYTFFCIMFLTIVRERPNLHDMVSQSLHRICWFILYTFFKFKNILFTRNNAIKNIWKYPNFPNLEYVLKHAML